MPLIFLGVLAGIWLWVSQPRPQMPPDEPGAALAGLMQSLEPKERKP